jgi:hypothetical protein
MWFCTPIQNGHRTIPFDQGSKSRWQNQPAGIALAVLALLPLGTARAQASFKAPLSFDAGSNPVSLAVGDFNGDGVTDLAVANAGGTTASDLGTVAILLGNGDGTFGAAVTYPAGVHPSSVAVGDFNGDGKPDLVVSNYGSNNVSLLLGNGDGTFQAAINFPVGSLPHFLAIGDFNGDGIPDLAVANSGSGTVSVLLGNGNGTFQAAVNMSAGDTPGSVAVGDFNGDGHMDLVIANFSVNGTVSVLLGNGDGTFQAAQNSPVGNGPSFFAVGDFNRDGVPDLAVVLFPISGSINAVSILLGNGDGTFQAPQNYAVGANPVGVAVGDFNGDAILDLAVTNEGVNGWEGSVSVLMGNGDGTFQTAQDYAVDSARTSSAVTFLFGDLQLFQFVVVGDFNGDGRPDLVVTNGGGNNVSVLLGEGGGTFPSAPSYTTGKGANGVAVGDFNGDGIADLAVTNEGSDNPGLPGSVSILLGNRDGSFQPAVNYATGLTSRGIVLGDFNMDGIPDLAVSNLSSNNVSVLLGNGDGTFQEAVNYVAGDSPATLTVADLNSDGIPDLAVANNGSNNLSILLGKGDGTFRAAKNYAAGLGPTSVAVGDFNDDGIPDLVVANSAYATNGQGGSVAVLLGNGDGTFQAAVSFPAGDGPFSVTVADLNGDGILDLAVVNLISSDVSVLLGKGNGTFQAAVKYAAGEYWFAPPAPLAVKDFNRDGIPDLALISGGGVRVLLGRGDGTFETTSISYVAGVGYGSVAAEDFNGDGFPDLAVAYFGTNGRDGGVSILLNDGKWVP